MKQRTVTNLAYTDTRTVVELQIQAMKQLFTNHRSIKFLGTILLAGIIILSATALYSGQPQQQQNLLPASPQTVKHCNKISQHGVTWHFDKPVPCGNFANKDWWVKGPVTVTRITPDFDGTMNGWNVNPVKSINTYDRRIPHNNFVDDALPSLPFQAQPNQSIVKAISSPTGECRSTDSKKHPCFLQTVAVLTILQTIPKDNGKTAFRPPYVGSEKPLYSTQSLKTDHLPSLQPVQKAPTLKWVEQEFSKVQFDHWKLWTGRYMHPSDNMPQYGSNIAISTNEAALRLMLNDPIQKKRQALINYVQAGIDYYHIMKVGNTWGANGGHFVGRKLPVVFAAILLDNEAMKKDLADAPANTFSEDGHTYLGSNGQALFGQECGEQHYWEREIRKKGRRDCRDPYGLIDGGGSEIGDAYQKCCTSQAYKGAALAAMLLKDGIKVWNHPPLFKYVDRWVEHGIWAAPDNCAMLPPEKYTGQCVEGTGRFIEKHGKGADSGYYQSAFVNKMWDFYREKVSGNTDP